MSETRIKNIFQRLLEVQKTAKAPREISGKFGKARSAEQIEEAYKPVCIANGLYLYTSDEITQVGNRNYVETTATVVNVDKPEEKHSAKAAAWENEVELSKSGFAILDTSQVTGKTSSYAKKYALQNLFAIDDTKDADRADSTDEEENYRQGYNKTAPKKGLAPTKKQIDTIRALANELGFEEAGTTKRIMELETVSDASQLISKLEEMKGEDDADKSKN